MREREREERGKDTNNVNEELQIRVGKQNHSNIIIGRQIGRGKAVTAVLL